MQRFITTLIALSCVLAFSVQCGTDDPTVAPDTASDASVQADTEGPDVAVTDALLEMAADVFEPLTFDPELQDSLQRILDDYVYFSGDPGIAFAVLDGPQKRWFSVAGLFDQVTQEKLTAQHRFRVGSNTKPMIAVVTLILYEEGLIDLEASLTEYLPEYDQWSDVTVRQLLSMQSGIPEFLNADDVWLQLLANPGKHWTPNEVLAFAKGMPMDFVPGESAAYSNTNYTLLGLIMEAATGETAHSLMRTRLFEPLGMADTYLEMEGDATDSLVHGYMDMGVLALLMGLPELMLALLPPEMFVGDTLTVDATEMLPPSFTWTAGSVVSKPTDLAGFMKAFHTGKLLTPDTMDQVYDFSPCALLGTFVDYGLGTMRQHTAFGDALGHGGLNFGYHVETYYLPDHDVSFSHMHNYLPAQATAVTDDVVRTVLDMAPPAPKPCQAPHEFLGEPGPDEPYVKLLFRGTVNHDGAPQEDYRAGMANTWVYTGENQTRYYGFDRIGIFSSAIIKDDGLGPRITIEAFGPGTEDKYALGQLTVNLDPKLFEAVDDEGRIELGPGQVYSVVTVLADIFFEGGVAEGIPKQACIAAVPDYSLPSRVFFCDPETVQAQPGTPLRMVAYLGMTRDPEKIENYIKVIGLEPCSCLDPEGEFIPCEDQ